MTTTDEALRVAMQSALTWMENHGEVVLDGGGWAAIDSMNKCAADLRSALRTIALAVEAPNEPDLTDEERAALASGGNVIRDCFAVDSLAAKQDRAEGGSGQDAAPTEWLLYEHDDGRQAVAPNAEAATFAHGDPAWHRVGPVEMHAVQSVALAGGWSELRKDFDFDLASASGAVGETAALTPDEIDQVVKHLELGGHGYASKDYEPECPVCTATEKLKVKLAAGAQNNPQGCEVSKFSSQVCALGTYGCTASHDSNGKENGNG